MSDQPPVEHVGEAAETTKGKREKKTPRSLDAASPASSPSAIAAGHKREMERERTAREHEIACKKLEHELAEATQAAVHKRKMDQWMFLAAVVASLIGVAVGIYPGISDDLKKTVIAALLLIV